MAMSGRIVDYQIVYGHSTSSSDALEQLTEEVRKAISDGWEPMGGAGGGSDNSYAFLFQAMVKCAENQAISN
jgi:hypothetical protein